MHEEDGHACRNLYRFVRLRVDADLSDREVARRWGMPWRSFTLLKQGLRHVPRLEQLTELAAVLGVDAVVVYGVAAGLDADLVHALLQSDPEPLVGRLLPRIAGTSARSPSLVRLVRRGPVALIEVDTDGRVQATSHALTASNGASTLYDCTGPRHRARARRALGLSARTEREVEYEATMTIDGAPAPRRCRVRPLLADAQLFGFIVACLTLSPRLVR